MVTNACTGSQSRCSGGSIRVLGRGQRCVAGDERDDRGAGRDRHALHRLVLADRAPRRCRCVSAAAVMALTMSAARTCSGKRRREPSAAASCAWRSRCSASSERRAGGEALLRPLGQQLVDDELQAARAFGDHVDRRGILLRDLQRQRGGAGAVERGPAGDQFVEHDADGEEIRAPVELAAERLLRAHITRRAQHLADLRAQHLAFRAGAFAIGQARDAEIEDLDRAAVLAQHDVGRLDVAVDDAERVRVAERVGQLASRSPECQQSRRGPRAGRPCRAARPPAAPWRCRGSPRSRRRRRS